MFGASGDDPEGLGIVPRVLATLFGRAPLKLEDSSVCVATRVQNIRRVLYFSTHVLFCV